MTRPLLRRSLWLQFGVYLVLLVAFALQLHDLGARTFHGDELGSVTEAKNLGLNANSLPYFALLRIWLTFGGGEYWLRSPSALAAVAGVAATFAAVKALSGKRVALATCLLLATSPFLLVYGQQVRFYTLGLATAGLSIWACIRYLQHPNRRSLLVWLGACCLAVTALLVNALLVLGQVLTWFVLTPSVSKIVKTRFAVAAAGSSLLLLLVPGMRALAFDAFARYTNASSHYVTSRGLELTQVAKIPLTLYFFAFGESVYPLSYWLVVPGMILIVAVFVIGLTKLRQNPPILTAITITGVTALVALYFVLDPLAPQDLQGAAPRYLIFLLPLFYLVLAAGVQGKRTSFLIAPFLAVNIASIGAYWQGAWAYTDDLIDWRTVTSWLSTNVTPQTVLLLDGRASGNADYYFPSDWTRLRAWDYETSEGLGDLTKYSRIVFLSNDFRAEPRTAGSELIRRLETEYDETAVWSQYPLFAYVYDRKAAGVSGYHVNAMTGQADLPFELYGNEFQDLRLPIWTSVNGYSLLLTGAFALPDLDGQTARAIPFDRLVPARQIVLFSTLTGAGSLSPGALIANLRTIDDQGAEQVIALRSGYETSAWNIPCVAGTCRTAFQWSKRLALLGGERYLESWSEFQASIFAADLKFARPAQIASIRLERTRSPGTLYVWGVVLEP